MQETLEQRRGAELDMLVDEDMEEESEELE